MRYKNGFVNTTKNVRKKKFNKKGKLVAGFYLNFSQTKKEVNQKKYGKNEIERPKEDVRGNSNTCQSSTYFSVVHVL